nr:immunoglobulin light chain junction region [Macaca mulatta]
DYYVSAWDSSLSINYIF